VLDRFETKPWSWTKHHWFRYERGRGNVNCLAGRLMGVRSNAMVDHGAINADPECLLVAEIIKEQFPDRLRSSHRLYPSSIIPTFNDHPNTTLEDVQLVLRKAAIQCDEVLGA
jgi:hypothetical protein